MSFRFNLLTFVAISFGASMLAHAHNGHTTAAEPVSGITIDGDLSDWPSGMKTHFITTSLVVCDATPSEDVFNGKFRVGCDYKENAIYVAVEVEDDQIVLDGFGDQWNSYDACEVFLTVAHTAENTSPVQFVYRNKPYTTFQDRENGAYAKAMKVARVSDDTHLTFEWRIDLRELTKEDIDLKKGAVLGFDVAYVDRDSEDVYAFYCSSPGRWKHLYSTEQGDLIVPPSGSKMAQFAGKIAWSSPQSKSPTALQLRSVTNDSMFLQVPVASNGQFMTSLPTGEYEMTTKGLEDPLTVSSQYVSLQRDTILSDPIVFEVAEKVSVETSASNRTVMYDLGHGQQQLKRLESLGDKVGYKLTSWDQPITKSALHDVQLIYLLGPTNRFSEAEKDTIVDFVKDGGSMLLVVDESRRMSLRETGVNDLIEPFGMQITGDTEYVHNCGARAMSGPIHKRELEIPFSGGRAVEGGKAFAFQLDRQGNSSHPMAAFAELDGGGRVVVVSEAMASLFLGTEEGERLSGTPRNYAQTQYWGKDSEQFNSDLLAWLLQGRGI